MKTVFNNSQCAHVWAQLNQDNGRNSGGSMSFRGGVAYSYRTPIAHIMRRADGGRVALFTNRSYSVSTSRHESLYRRALDRSVPTFTVLDRGVPTLRVPDLFVGEAKTVDIAEHRHAENVGYLAGVYAEEFAKLMRVPCTSRSVMNAEQDSLLKTRAHATLKELADQHDNYCRAFGIHRRLIDWEQAADVVIARRDRLLADPKRAAARERNESRRLAAEAEQRRLRALSMAEKLAEWRSGASMPYFNYTDADGSARFRLRTTDEGTVVQTSRNAVVPLLDVKRGLKIYNAVRAAGIPWQIPDDRAGYDSAKLGHFTLDSIAMDGSARAGCHYFSADAIAELQALIAAHETDTLSA